MNNKPKIKDVAKDLGVSTQELIDFFAEKEIVKKTTTSITEEEMTILLETYSQKNQVNSFDEYFASKADKKPKEQVAAVSEPKTAKPDKKPETQTVKQPKKPVTQQPAQKEVKPVTTAKAPVNADKPVVQKNNTNQTNNNGVNKLQSNKPASDNKPKPKVTFIPNTNKAPVRPNNVPNNNKPVTNKPNQIDKFKQQVNKGAAVLNNNNPHKSQEKVPQHAHSHGVKTQLNANIEATPTVNSNVRTIDTRGNYVELDKYNEKYTNMAPEQRNRGKDAFMKKQKLTQKSQQRNKQQYSNKRETETEKLKRLDLERARKQQLKVLIPDEIVVSELAIRLKVTATDVIKKLMGLGEMKTINDTIDFDTASLVAEEFGAKVEKEVIVTVEERLIDDSDDDDDNLEERPPVVVVMGHVDHGKTSLLDKIRNANVTEGEAGGITQHIGAYSVKINDRNITFLDTPGHAAFTSMRARGAQVTDIAIIVVAADDGIMPQTIEAINHAKAAGVSIIVAINKMDKPEANPDRVKQELTEQGLVVEEWGGDVICVPVSAKTGEGINDLLENIILVADVQELKANPNRLAKGTVIEARLDKGRGTIATLLVQNGTLHTGDVIIAGTAVGRVRVMTNDKGKVTNEAGPSVPVEITGLAEVPSAGDIFNAVQDEKLARELVAQRKHNAKEEIFSKYQKVTLDNLFNQIADGEMKELPIIVKADVQGSVEAVKQALEKISNDEVRVKVIHGAVGAVSESDVMLANASNAIIIGFNVRPDPIAVENAKRDDVDMRFYRIIYDAIEEVSTAMKGMLAPKFREVMLGRIEVRMVYKITNVGLVAGCYVLSGKVTRNAQIRVVRDGIVIAEDKMSSLKRFKDDAKEVAANFECGITLDKFSDIHEGDIFEAFIMEEYKD